MQALLEGAAEGAVAAEAAFLGQLLGGDGTTVGNRLAIECDEMLDAQGVDVGVVVHALTGEILAEIKAVNANLSGESGNINVMLQIET